MIPLLLDINQEEQTRRNDSWRCCNRLWKIQCSIDDGEPGWDSEGYKDGSREDLDMEGHKTTGEDLRDGEF